MALWDCILVAPGQDQLMSEAFWQNEANEWGRWEPFW